MSRSLTELFFDTRHAVLEIRELGDGHLVGQDGPLRPELNRLGLGLFGERHDPIGRLLRSPRSGDIAVGLFGHPVPRGSRAVWAGESQALSPVAATTCRVRTAAWKARRGLAKVRLNGLVQQGAKVGHNKIDARTCEALESRVAP